MPREFDYIIYGASGFTGQYVVERLAKFLKEKPTVKWAVAGRNRTKIAETMAASGKIVGWDLATVPIVVADSADEASLVEMAKRAKIVINCVGPVGRFLPSSDLKSLKYRLYGEPVVRACVENGTSHVDISGEPIFLEGMQVDQNEFKTHFRRNTTRWPRRTSATWCPRAAGTRSRAIWASNIC